MDKHLLIGSSDGVIMCYHGGALKLSAENEFFCECPQPFSGRQCEFDLRHLEQSDSYISKHIIDIVIIIFFLLLLPSLILYCIRILYLFLKRWGQSSKEVAITVLPQPLPEVTIAAPQAHNHSMYRTISLPPEVLRKSPSICIVHRTHSLNPRRSRKISSRRQFVYYGVIDGPMVDEQRVVEERPPSYDTVTTHTQETV